MEQECGYPASAGMALRVPPFIKEMVAQLTFEARACNEINQSSGVSVRVTDQQLRIASSPTPRSAPCASATTRSCRAFPTCTSLYASTAGKIELEYVGEDKKEEDLIERLINRAVLKVFDRYFKIDDLRRVAALLRGRDGASRSPTIAPAAEYLDALREVPGLREAVEQLGPFESPGPDGGRERAGLRGPAPSSEAQQGAPRRALRLSRLRRQARRRR